MEFEESGGVLALVDFVILLCDVMVYLGTGFMVGNEIMRLLLKSVVFCYRLLMGLLMGQ